MKLLLPNPDFEPSFKMEHSHKLFFMGSCFSDSMVQYFRQRKFDCLSNPHGVIYNPVSLAKSLSDIVTGNPVNRDSIYAKDKVFASFYHHSQFASSSEAELIERIEKVNTKAAKFLANADVAFITLGTAWAYYHKELQAVVANNLKAPKELFERRLLTSEEIEVAIVNIIESIRSVKENIRIVFTVSPVRHTKQGLAENNRSKACLINAVHNAVEKDESLSYFPSYELVVDVLRDYRFYKKDLVHPNELATDYIWDFLQAHFIAEKDKALLDKLYNLYLATQHKVLNPKSESAQLFKKSQLENLNSLEQSYPYINLEEERNYFDRL